MALVIIEYGMSPSEFRGLDRGDRTFMTAAMLWKNEEEHEAAKRVRARRKK